MKWSGGGLDPQDVGAFLVLSGQDNLDIGGGDDDNGCGCGCVILIIAVLVLLLMLICAIGSCSSCSNDAPTSNTQSTTPNNTYSHTPVAEDEDEDEAADAKNDTTTTKAETKEDIPRLPKVDMDAKYIDKTELGKHDGKPETLDNGKWRGGTRYEWYSKNGKKDLVFAAITRDGKVIKVFKHNTDLNYWADGTFLGRDFPDLKASGATGKQPEASEPELYDPVDYDNPAEYADDAEAYFEYHGASDPWQKAYEYWEKNGP